MKTFVLSAFTILLLGFLILVIPGLDILAWRFLQPATFWQKIILVAIEVLSAWPRVIFDIIVGGFGISLLAEIFK